MRLVYASFMVRTGLEKSLKNGAVLEDFFNFEISTFFLERSLIVSKTT